MRPKQVRSSLRCSSIQTTFPSFHTTKRGGPGLGPGQPAGGSLGQQGSRSCPSSDGELGPGQSHFFCHFKPREEEGKKKDHLELTLPSKATFARGFNTSQMCLFLREPSIVFYLNEYCHSGLFSGHILPPQDGVIRLQLWGNKGNHVETALPSHQK